MPYRKMDVEVPTDPKQPARMALIAVSDENLSKEADEGKWQEQLVKPLWKLVTEAINRPAALKRVYDDTLSRLDRYATGQGGGRS